MTSTKSTGKLLKRLWIHIRQRRRKQLVYLFFLTILASVTEVVSISAIVPFLGVLTEPEQVFNYPAVQPFIHALGISSYEQLPLPLTILFICAALVAGMMRLLLLWATTRLSFATGADLSFEIYQRTLYQPYTTHLSRNSSEILNGVTTKVNSVIINVIVPILFVLSSFFLILAILVVLIIIKPFVAFVSISVFGIIYILLALISRKKLLTNGEHIARESTQVIKCIQEGLGGIRDILIDGTQANYAKKYRTADLQLRYSQGANIFISQSPRYAIEALGMMFIAVLAYFLTTQSGGIESAIPILGALALGASRLLPLLQRMYLGWASLQGGLASLGDTIDLLDQTIPDYAELPPPDPLSFQKSLRFNNISFKYSEKSPWIIKNVNYIISKGSRIGLIGSTGSGKTTLLDIFMGLLTPTEGEFEVDNQVITQTNVRAWQAHIAHVPQNIYLADSSIEENIAFGIPIEQIDKQRVKHAAEQAQISDLIEGWPNQYQTSVGERGIMLSGGQLQRIGIARALYKQVDVIIFDEATSALDSKTEKSVMQSIENLSQELTILIIAHRQTTLKGCSHIIDLSDSKNIRVGSYDEIINICDNDSSDL